MNSALILQKMKELQEFVIWTITPILSTTTAAKIQNTQELDRTKIRLLVANSKKDYRLVNCMDMDHNDKIRSSLSTIIEYLDAKPDNPLKLDEWATLSKLLNKRLKDSR